MTLDEYQAKAAATSLMKPGDERMIIYTALGLNGEAGEVADKVKKILRDQDGDFSKLDKADITKELGDVMWYVAMFAKSIGITLDDVGAANIEKLTSRKQRGVLGGSGDNR
jgi:NTP pyrophosphatase (non-canonical NTP hydrolase)